MRVEQEEAPAVPVPAVRRDVQHQEWQSWAAMNGEGESMLGGEREGRGGKGKAGIERDAGKLG